LPSPSRQADGSRRRALVVSGARDLEQLTAALDTVTRQLRLSGCDLALADRAPQGSPGEELAGTPS
jgi:hypothetical protein